jgi:hypothetical protein
MPRRSAEARVGAYFRTGGKPLGPPAHMTADTKRIWHVITASKPPDYFSPASGPLLEAFCEALVMHRFYMSMWREDRANAGYLKSICMLNASLSQLATKLRLAITSIDKKSGILNEREAGPSDGGNILLFGGHGVRF